MVWEYPPSSYIFLIVFVKYSLSSFSLDPTIHPPLPVRASLHPMAPITRLLSFSRMAFPWGGVLFVTPAAQAIPPFFFFLTGRSRACRVLASHAFLSLKLEAGTSFFFTISLGKLPLLATLCLDFSGPWGGDSTGTFVPPDETGSSPAFMWDCFVHSSSLKDAPQPTPLARILLDMLPWFAKPFPFGFSGYFCPFPDRFRSRSSPVDSTGVSAFCGSTSFPFHAMSDQSVAKHG